MVLPRCGIVASLMLVMACSSTPRSARSHSNVVASATQRDVLAPSAPSEVDLSALPRMEGRLDDALHAATAIVLGIRRIEDACGTYIDLRMFPEVHLGGREVTEPADADEVLELRALLYLPNSNGKCDEPTARVVETNHLAVGDRIVVALARVVSNSRDVPTWKRTPRVVALGPVEALPVIAAALPKPAPYDEFEQFLPVPRMPGVGTPASRRLLGNAPRFEVVGDEIVDRAQGIVWQRQLAKKTMSFEEAAVFCETQRTGGHDDWRLPTAFEMHGIFAPSIPPPALVDRKLFSAPEDALLWTRTDDDGPWVGSPEQGILISTHYDDPSPYGNYHVRCVRPATTRATEMVDRFATKERVVQDALSGLSWYLVPEDKAVTHAAAKQICEQGTFAGFDDWQMPTVEAAFSLMSGCPEAVENWEGTAEDVWTSMVDVESKVGGTFGICNLYRSVPLAAIFEKEGVDPKNPVARVMCMRETAVESPPEAKSCLAGTQEKRVGHFSSCEERGVRHGPYRSFWPSGGVFETGTYEQGARHGPFVLYHESGAIYAHADYQQGKLHGDVWVKRPTGMFLFKGAYANGLPSGRWTFFDVEGQEIEYIDMTAGKAGAGQYARFGSAGRKIIECPTQGGFEHGVERYVDEATGRVQAEYTYENGWLEGPAKTFDGKGGQTWQHHRDERDGVWVAKNSEGKIVYRQSFRAGKLDGVQESFDKAGKLISTRRYRDGLAVGKWETRTDDGVLVQKGDLDEEGTGTTQWFEPNGRLDRTEQYVRGKRHGTWLEYHSPKQLRRKEEYQDDQLLSETEWHEDGKIAEKMTFANGKRNGLTERYDNQGRLRWRGSYVNGLREGKWEVTTVTGRHYEVVYEKGKAVSMGGTK